MTAMSAASLYAISQGTKTQGKEECHWCSSPCSQLWMHDDPPPIPFLRTRSTAKRPNANWICVGCWMWRRGSITAKFLDGLPSKITQGTLKDRQQAKYHSWWITEVGAWALKPTVNPPPPFNPIWELLLKPPPRFVLAVLDGQDENRIQLARCNDYGHGLKADDPLEFTVNATAFAFTLFELGEYVKGSDVLSPGLNELVRLFGPPPRQAKAKQTEGRKALPDGKVPKRAIYASGGVAVA